MVSHPPNPVQNSNDAITCLKPGGDDPESLMLSRHSRKKFTERKSSDSGKEAADFFLILTVFSFLSPSPTFSVHSGSASRRLHTTMMYRNPGGYLFRRHSRSDASGNSKPSVTHFRRTGYSICQPTTPHCTAPLVTWSHDASFVQPVLHRVYIASSAPLFPLLYSRCTHTHLRYRASTGSPSIPT